ncbi:MAG: hypothetical protein GX925_00860 [Clostridiales bacterium]|nr:hypothetical protein [Clostridiales bacterium]
MKNVILSEAKDLKWPKNEILRYTQNDKKREKCFFTQSDISIYGDLEICRKWLNYLADAGYFRLFTNCSQRYTIKYELSTDLPTLSTVILCTYPHKIFICSFNVIIK